jgi:glutamyl-tRNA reductase
MAEAPAAALGAGLVEPALLLVGVDHHRSPVQLRERLAVAESAVAEALGDVAAVPGVSGGLLLSTCNRVEWLLAGTPDPEAVLERLAERQGIGLPELSQHAYRLRGREAVRHCFRVACGLESLVLGEQQIVHQFKQALELARGSGRLAPLVDRVAQRALAVGAEIRTATGLGARSASVASVGVDLARQIHGDLSRARVLLVGAGEIAELVAVQLAGAGAMALTIINRTQERAERLAAQLPLPPRIARWADLGEALAGADIVITSTAATRPIISRDDVRRLLRGRDAPLLLIDLAVPRDVEPGVGELAGVFLYNLDHLDRVVEEHRARQRSEAEAASTLVDGHVASLLAETAVNRSGLPAQVAGWCGALVDSELDQARRRLPDADAEILRHCLDRVAGKFRHRLLAWLREHQGDPAAERTIRDLLELDRESGS